MDCVRSEPPDDPALGPGVNLPEAEWSRKEQSPRDSAQTAMQEQNRYCFKPQCLKAAVGKQNSLHDNSALKMILPLL